MKIRDVMTNQVRTVAPETSVFELARIMRDEDIGAVPIADDNRLVGMVTDRDIVVRGLAVARERIAEATARSVMTEPVLYCFADQEVEDVLENMGVQQVRRLPVVDRDKRLVGVVSLGDLSGKSSPDVAGDSLSRISHPASRH